MITMLYHDVIDDALAGSSGFQGADADHYKLAPVVFDAHLACGPSSDPSVLFTFDDAGISALSPCADLLDARGVKGLFFVPTDCIARPGFCTGADLRALHQRGHRIGSHSASHPVPISGLPDPAIADEWSRSRRVLEDIVGVAITDASVPGGFTSSRVEAAAAATGYRRLFTSQPTRRVRVHGDMSIHGRFSVTRATPVAVVASVLAGDRLPWLQQAAWWEAKKIVKRVGGTAWLRFRKRYFSQAAGS